MTDHAHDATQTTAAHLSLLQTLSPPILTGSPAWSITFTPDAKYLAICFGCPSTCVKVWRCDGAGSKANDGTPNDNVRWIHFATIEGHTRSIRDVKFAPLSTCSSLILATASFDGMVMIWECQHTDDMMDSGIDSDDENNLQVFEPIAQLEGHENEVKHIVWNQTGSLLASCGRDKTVWVWECFLPGTMGGGAVMSEQQDDGDFECLAVLQGHDGDVKSITFAPSHSQWGDGEEILISASYDNSIKIWAEESGDWYCAATLGPATVTQPTISPNDTDNISNARGAVHTSTIWCLGVYPGGVRFLSGSEDGSIAIWKMYTASERKRLAQQQYVSTDGLWNCVGVLPEAHEGYAVLSIDCAPSRAGHGRVVSGGGDNSIRVYREVGGGCSDAPKFDIDAVIENAHLGDINCVKWHPIDGSCLISCGDDGAVKIWRYIQQG